MAVRKSRQRKVGGWGRGHIAQLMFGSDFFGTGWGTTRWGIENGKVSAEIIDDMKAAWAELRPQVMQEWAKRQRIHAQPWAARYFDGPEGEPSKPEPAELCEV